jgi:hypothetical protein
MSTHEEDLKAIVADIELLEAEVASNNEELYRIPFEGYTARRSYLHLRNIYVEERLSKLREKRTSKLEVIEWEKRTS